MDFDEAQGHLGGGNSGADGEGVRSPRAFRAHPGRTYSRTDLLNLVWGYQFEGYEHTVNSHINRLRAKIETDPGIPGICGPSGASGTGSPSRRSFPA